MRRMTSLIVPVGLLLLVATPVFAQGRGGRGMGGGAMLLMNESVQQELKLDTNQAEKVRATMEEIGPRMRDAFQGFQDLSPEERVAKMTEVNRTMMADVRKSLGEVLKPEQWKRFDQIVLQQRGLAALEDSEVAGKLKLTDDQKAKIKAISADLDSERRGVSKDQGGFQRIRELSRASFEKAAALLTADQKKAWDELTGKPFEIQYAPRNN